MSRIPTYTLIICSFFCLGNRALAQVKFSKQMLQNPKEYGMQYEAYLPINEIELYQHPSSSDEIILENGYADFELRNAGEWPPQNVEAIPTSVTVIFTKYPKDREFWLTDYHWLLAKRLEALFQLDSNLNSESVRYSILLQTSCDNEFEAMQLFHGISIGYREASDENDEEGQLAEVEEVPTASSTSLSPNASSVKRIKRFMAKERMYVDSTVYKVLERNDWQEATLVLDWTGSMYGHGAEAILWHALNEERSGIEHVVYFNDGDRKSSRRKVIGFTGGIYIEEAKPVSKPLKLFTKVKNKGSGGDSPENDVEALIAAVNKIPETTELILIADNASCIRDFALLGCIKRPVHVVLCNTQSGINHQYVNLAWKTGGSLHTADQDIDDLNSLVMRDSVYLGDVHFTLTSDYQLMPIDRRNNRFGYCDRYYRISDRKVFTRRKSKSECYFTD